MNIYNYVVVPGMCGSEEVLINLFTHDQEAVWNHLTYYVLGSDCLYKAVYTQRNNMGLNIYIDINACCDMQ